MEGEDYVEPENIEENDGPLLQESIESILQAKLSQPVRALREFMSKGNFRTEKTDPNRNIIDNTEKRIYTIPPTHLPTFFQRLEACRMEGRTMHFAERQATGNVARTGIVIDIDIFQRPSTRIVTTGHLRTFVSRVSRALADTLDFAPAEQAFEFYAFIITRTAVTPCDDNMYKDGFHLIIPEVQVTPAYKKFLINHLASNRLVEYTFKDIMGQIAKPEKLLDHGSASFPVNFVGSAKAGGTAYPLTHAFAISVDLSDNSTQLTPISVDGLAHGISPDGAQINLAYELSLGFYFEYLDGNPTWLRKTEYEYSKDIEANVQLIVEKRRHGVDEEADTNDDEVDILTTGNAEAAYIKNLLLLLDISYATQYDKWYKVIFAIANANTRYKALAEWFSRRNPGAFNPAEFERIWNEGLNARNARGAPLTKRSIVYWAKESSPERFKEIEQENYLNLMARAVYYYEGVINHAECAKIIHSMVGDKFVCDVPSTDKSSPKREWYEFVLPEQSHRVGEVYKWRHEDDPDPLRCFMSDQLPKVYQVQLERIKERKDAAETERDSKYWAALEIKLKKSQTELGNNTYQRGVLAQCALRFRARGFTDELDSYPDVIGVGNGVLRLGIRPELIQRFHEYKISKFTPTKYRPYNPNNTYIRELLQIIRDIIVEEDAFNFIMFYISTFIDMKTVACKLLKLKGAGQNGKTFLINMLIETLGEQYCAQFKSPLLTGPDAKPNEANSAKMILKGKSGAVCDEFNPTDMWNTMSVKSLANPGRITGRDLYVKDLQPFRMTANIMICTNHDLNTNDTDHGFWRRIMYYVCRVRFCANPDPLNPYEKKVNSRIMDEYPYDQNYQEAFLSILVHYHTRLQAEYSGDIKRVPCPTIMRQTEEYRNRQDTINRFINMFVVVSPHSDPVALDTIGSAYHAWYNTNVRQCKMDMQATVAKLETSKLQNFIVKRDDTTWALTGHRLRDNQESPLMEGESFLFKQQAPATPGGDDDEVTNVGYAPAAPAAPTAAPNKQPVAPAAPTELSAEMIEAIRANDAPCEDDLPPMVLQNKAADRARKIAERQGHMQQKLQAMGIEV